MQALGALRSRAPKSLATISPQNPALSKPLLNPSLAHPPPNRNTKSTIPTHSSSSFNLYLDTQISLSLYPHSQNPCSLQGAQKPAKTKSTHINTFPPRRSILTTTPCTGMCYHQNRAYKVRAIHQLRQQQHSQRG